MRKIFLAHCLLLLVALSHIQCEMLSLSQFVSHLAASQEVAKSFDLQPILTECSAASESLSNLAKCLQEKVPVPSKTDLTRLRQTATTSGSSQRQFISKGLSEKGLKQLLGFRGLQSVLGKAQPTLNKEQLLADVTKCQNGIVFRLLDNDHPADVNKQDQYAFGLRFLAIECKQKDNLKVVAFSTLRSGSYLPDKFNQENGQFTEKTIKALLLRTGALRLSS